MWLPCWVFGVKDGVRILQKAKVSGCAGYFKAMIKLGRFSIMWSRNFLGIQSKLPDCLCRDRKSADGPNVGQAKSDEDGKGGQDEVRIIPGPVLRCFWVPSWWTYNYYPNLSAKRQSEMIPKAIQGKHGSSWKSPRMTGVSPKMGFDQSKTTR